MDTIDQFMTTSREVARTTWCSNFCEPERGYHHDSHRITYQIFGSLADRCRRKLGVEVHDMPVFFVELQDAWGYSEVTLERDYSFTLECGYETKEFKAYWSNGVKLLVDWLDGK